MRPTDQQISVVNPTAENLAERLGITPERRKEVQKRLDKICEDELNREAEGKPDGAMDEANIIVAVYNEFEGAECAYGLFILQQEEGRVAMNSFFGLPESVTTED